MDLLHRRERMTARSRRSRDNQSNAARRAAAAAEAAERQAAQATQTAIADVVTLREQLTTTRQELLTARRQIRELTQDRHPAESAVMGRLDELRTENTDLRERYAELAEAALERQRKDARAIQALDMLAQLAWALRKHTPANDHEAKLFTMWTAWRNAQLNREKDPRP